MYVTNHEVSLAQPQFFDSQNNGGRVDLGDLQGDFRRHQKALLKALHIKDKTHALRDPAEYFKALTWQVVERCFDRTVWSEARPTYAGKGYGTTAHCAVFRTNDAGTMIPTLWAKVSYRTAFDEAGETRLDARGNPVLEPDAHIVETDLQGLKRHSGLYFQFRQKESQRGIEVYEAERMGRAVLLDSFDAARYLDTFGDDVLAIINDIEQQTDAERESADYLAYLATHRLVHGPNF